MTEQKRWQDRYQDVDQFNCDPAEELTRKVEVVEKFLDVLPPELRIRTRDRLNDWHDDDAGGLMGVVEVLSCLFDPTW